jgi:Uma2 family endonuclease
MPTSGPTAIPATGERLYTYADVLRELPESNRPCELWDGKLVMPAAPFFQHQKVVLRLCRKLDDWVSTHGLGEVVAAPIDMVLSPRQVVQPDVAYIAADRLDIVRNAIIGHADLVAEVISPGGRNRDRIEKRDLYEQHAIKEYWIIDPEAETVEVLWLNERQQYELATRCLAGQSASSQLLSGFAVGVDYLFHGQPSEP